jgi:hypothetical protein
MGPEPSQPQTATLFRPRLDAQINMQHPLVRLAALIDWTEIERTFSASFTSGRGRPALAPETTSSTQAVATTPCAAAWVTTSSPAPTGATTATCLPAVTGKTP